MQPTKLSIPDGNPGCDFFCSLRFALIYYRKISKAGGVPWFEFAGIFQDPRWAEFAIQRLFLRWAEFVIPLFSIIEFAIQ